ncbi:MAG: SCP2 sterol-binding domain-containing protein [Bdellovibrionales bacterium]|nr:SCP2 sterol-binding domain-containing protein [Bdellovibrionales bacterium]
MEDLVHSFAAECFADSSKPIRVALEVNSGKAWCIDCIRKEIEVPVRGRVDLSIKGDESALNSLLKGQETPQRLLLEGKITVEGSRESALQVSKILARVQVEEMR